MSDLKPVTTVIEVRRGGKLHLPRRQETVDYPLSGPDHQETRCGLWGLVQIKGDPFELDLCKTCMWKDLGE